MVEIERTKYRRKALPSEAITSLVISMVVFAGLALSAPFWLHA